MSKLKVGTVQFNHKPGDKRANETDKADDEMVIAGLDLALLENSLGRRWMRGRRPELYAPLTEKTRKKKVPELQDFHNG